MTPREILTLWIDSFNKADAKALAKRLYGQA